MFRLFIALSLPDPVKRDLTLLAYGLPGARWVAPGNLHLNLRFIGEVDGGQFQDIRDSLSDVRVDPFDLTLKGTGFFPPKQLPHTLWAGVEKNESLTILHSRVEAVLARIGFPRDSRKYAPHVTVARLSDAPVQRVADWLSGNALFKTEAFPVGSFCLYSSSLTGHGAEYEIEQEYELHSNGHPGV
jgi:2'-5' RNA ligase